MTDALLQGAGAPPIGTDKTRVRSGNWSRGNHPLSAGGGGKAEHKYDVLSSRQQRNPPGLPKFLTIMLTNVIIHASVFGSIACRASVTGSLDISVRAEPAFTAGVAWSAMTDALLQGAGAHRHDQERTNRDQLRPQAGAFVLNILCSRK